MSDGRHPTEGCLDAETLAAFMDGRLEPRERAAVEVHLAECEDCYEVWMESVANAREAVIPQPSPSRWYVWAGIAAAALMAVSLPWLLRSNGQRSDVDDLAFAVGRARTTTARVAGPFAWGEPPAVTRGADRTVTLPPEADIAMGRIRQQVERDRTPRNLAVLGAAKLVFGDTTAAIEALEEATAQDRGSASAWTDLSAAYLERSAEPGYALDVPRAVQAAEEALALDPNLPAAIFNLALGLERLNADPVSAWERYLSVDNASPWAEEVRKRLAAWKARLDSTRASDLQEQRDRLLFDVSARWIEAPTRALALRDGSALVDVLNRVHEDRLADDFLRTLSTARPAGETSRLTDGVKALLAGRRAFLENRFDDALPVLLSAERTLTPLTPPMAAMAAYYRGLTLYRKNDFAGAIVVMTRLRAALVPLSAPSLLGQVESNLGLIAVTQLRPRDSLTHYEQAISAFGQAHEFSRVAFVEGLVATHYDLLGDDIRSWDRRLKALAGSRRESTLLSAAEAASRVGWHRTAAALQTSAVRQARRRLTGPPLIDVLRLAALGQARVGAFEAARRLQEEASTHAIGLEGEGGRRMRAELSGTRAEIEVLAGTRPAAASGDVDAALDYFEQAGLTKRLPLLLLTRARIRISEGQTSMAQKDLRLGLDLLESTIDQLPRGTDMGTFGAIVRELVDESAVLEIAADHQLGALTTLGRFRGLGLKTASQRRLWQASDLVKAMPEGVVLIAFLVQEKATVVWAVRNGRSEMAVVPRGRSELRQWTRSLSIKRFDQSAARSLRDALLTPVASLVEAHDVIVFVPDGPLHRVPFAALPGKLSRFLVEEHPIALAPHLSLDAPALTSLESLLIIGNPAYNRADFTNLQPLSGAQQEATGIGQLHGDRATVLTGSDASVTAFWSKLPRASLIHFAGHALVNDRVPGQSKLVIGSGITAADLELEPLTRHPLVVLASCESNGGVMTESEGPLGLARSVLRAGASTVIASHWPADDGRLPALMIRFHEALIASHDPIRSLWEAQAGAARVTDPNIATTPYWAGLVAMTTTYPQPQHHASKEPFES